MKTDATLYAKRSTLYANRCELIQELLNLIKKGVNHLGFGHAALKARQDKKSRLAMSSKYAGETRNSRRNFCKF